MTDLPDTPMPDANPQPDGNQVEPSSSSSNIGPPPNLSTRLPELEPQLTKIKTFRTAITELTEICRDIIEGKRNIVSDDGSSSKAWDVNAISDDDLNKLCDVSDTARKNLQAKMTKVHLWELGLDLFLCVQTLLEEKTSLNDENTGSKWNKRLESASKNVEIAVNEVDEEKRGQYELQKATFKRERDAKNAKERAETMFSGIGMPGMSNQGNLMSLMEQLLVGGGGGDFSWESFQEAARNAGLAPPTDGDIESLINRFGDKVNPKAVHHKERHELRIVTILKEEGEDCCICLEKMPFKSKAKEFPGCKHVFHDECIMKSIEENKSCPLCRGDPLKGIRVFTTDDDKICGPAKGGIFS